MKPSTPSKSTHSTPLFFPSPKMADFTQQQNKENLPNSSVDSLVAESVEEVFRSSSERRKSRRKQSLNRRVSFSHTVDVRVFDKNKSHWTPKKDETPFSSSTPSTPSFATPQRPSNKEIEEPFEEYKPSYQDTIMPIKESDINDDFELTSNYRGILSSQKTNITNSPSDDTSSSIKDLDSGQQSPKLISWEAPFVSDRKSLLDLLDDDKNPEQKEDFSVNKQMMDLLYSSSYSKTPQSVVQSLNDLLDDEKIGNTSQVFPKSLLDLLGDDDFFTQSEDNQTNDISQDMTMTRSFGKIFPQDPNTTQDMTMTRSFGKILAQDPNTTQDMTMTRSFGTILSQDPNTTQDMTLTKIFGKIFSEDHTINNVGKMILSENFDTEDSPQGMTFTKKFGAISPQDSIPQAQQTVIGEGIGVKVEVEVANVEATDNSKVEQEDQSTPDNNEVVTKDVVVEELTQTTEEKEGVVEKFAHITEEKEELTQTMKEKERGVVEEFAHTTEEKEELTQTKEETPAVNQEVNYDSILSETHDSNMSQDHTMNGSVDMAMTSNVGELLSLCKELEMEQEEEFETETQTEEMQDISMLESSQALDENVEEDQSVIEERDVNLTKSFEASSSQDMTFTKNFGRIILSQSQDNNDNNNVTQDQENIDQDMVMTKTFESVLPQITEEKKEVFEKTILTHSTEEEARQDFNTSKNPIQEIEPQNVLSFAKSPSAENESERVTKEEVKVQPINTVHGMILAKSDFLSRLENEDETQETITLPNVSNFVHSKEIKEIQESASFMSLSPFKLVAPEREIQPLTLSNISLNHINSTIEQILASKKLDDSIDMGFPTSNGDDILVNDSTFMKDDSILGTPHTRKRRHVDDIEDDGLHEIFEKAMRPYFKPFNTLSTSSSTNVSIFSEKPNPSFGSVSTNLPFALEEDVAPVPITFSEFTDIVALRFMDDFSSSKSRRNSSTNLSSKISDESDSDIIIPPQKRLELTCLELPKLNAVQTSSAELKERCVALDENCRKLEDEFNAKNPQIFSSAQTSNKEQLSELITTLKKLHKYCKLKSQQKLVQWRTNQQQSLARELQARLDTLKETKNKLESMNDEVHTLNAQIKQETQALVQIVESKKKKDDKCIQVTPRKEKEPDLTNLMQQLQEGEFLTRLLVSLVGYTPKRLSRESIVLHFQDTYRLEFVMVMDDQTDFSSPEASRAIDKTLFGFVESNKVTDTFHLGLLQSTGIEKLLESVENTKHIKKVVSEMDFRIGRVFQLLDEVDELKLKYHVRTNNILLGDYETRPKTGACGLLEVCFSSEKKKSKFSVLFELHYIYPSGHLRVHFKPFFGSIQREDVEKVVSSKSFFGVGRLTAVCDRLRKLLED